MKLPVTYFTLNEDSDETLLEKEFILCGWYTDYSGSQRGYISETFWKTTGVKQTDFTQGALKITLKSALYSEKEITAMQNSLNMDRNQYMDADHDTILNFCRITAVIAVMYGFCKRIFIYLQYNVYFGLERYPLLWAA